ncbi:MAG: hypothetical protein R2877_02930 [Bdellovibrionota bacterium]
MDYTRLQQGLDSLQHAEGQIKFQQHHQNSEAVQLPGFQLHQPDIS